MTAGTGPLRALLAAALVLLLLALPALWLRPVSGLEPLLPAGDAVLDRQMAFFTGRSLGRRLLLEAIGGDELARARVLEAAAQVALSHGALAPPVEDAAGLLRLTQRLATQAALLLDADDLRDLETLDVQRLSERLQALRELLLSPGGQELAAIAYRDPLGLVAGRLQALQRALGPQAGGPGALGGQGVVVHGEQPRSLLVFELDFEPADSARTAALLEALAAISVPADLRLEALGPHRSFRDNELQVRRDLIATLPLSLLLVLLVLVPLLRSPVVLAALHLPLVAAAAGAACALALAGPAVPAAVLGFAAGVLGIAVDYAIHGVHALRRGHHGQLARPLVLGYLSTAAAFAVLWTSQVPALRSLATAVIGGLGAALLCSLWLLPRLLSPAPVAQTGSWDAAAMRLLNLAESRPRYGAALALFVSVAALIGLVGLQVEDEPRRLDGSRPETITALAELERYWGGGGGHFLVGEGEDADRAVLALARARRACGLPPDPLGLLLPPAAVQEERRQAWRTWWPAQRPHFEALLAEAAAAAGVRAQAFAPGFEAYDRLAEAAPLAVATWDKTPAATLIGQLLQPAGSGFQALAPLRGEDAATLDAIAQRAAAEGAWLASRRVLGAALVRAVGDELLRLAGLTVVAIALVLILLLRRPRAVLTVLLPPVAALLWTFGALGWLGVALTPLHVLTATFVAGIGLDDAVFLAEPARRRRAIVPVLATTVTSVAGSAALIAAGHPIIHAVGIALVLGMSCCLLACLLLSPWLGGTRKYSEIQGEFGKRAGNMRYDVLPNGPT